jgi:multidrug transporter EmrE-like cation transporter
VALAGLLYAASGVGLLSWFGLRRLLHRASTAHEAPLTRHDLPWLAGAVVAGGVVAPVLLMLGLAATPAASAALLLNLEGVFTALLAWFVFRENFDRRIALGMGLIVLGVCCRRAGGRKPAACHRHGDCAACLCWAIDNNLTQKVSSADPMLVASVKGLAAGAVNLVIATASGWTPPHERTARRRGGGLARLWHQPRAVRARVARYRYGTHRRVFLDRALHRRGSVLIVLHGTPDILFWAAAALMLAGVWLHLTERHEHRHEHETLARRHAHVHDAHHRHAHDFAWDGREPHTHNHEHQPLMHSHPHYPDIHHRHRH